MNLLFSFSIAFLLMTVVYAALLIQHGIRKTVGTAGFCIALGLLFIFSQLAGTLDIRIITGLTVLNADLISTGIMLPVLAALMVIYISDGTLAAQQIIIGIIAALLLYAYLIFLLGSDLFSFGFASEYRIPALLAASVHAMTAKVTAFSIDIFLIPIFYQGLRNLKCRLFFAVAGSLVLVQLIDSCVYSLIMNLGDPKNWITDIIDSCLTKTIAVLWLSVMSSWYLARIEQEEPGKGRRALDIIIAFFGNYRKTKELEEGLRRSEKRYEWLFQSAGDPFFLTEISGRIIDANKAAMEITGLHAGEMLNGCLFKDLTGIDPQSGIGKNIATPVEMPRTKRMVELTFTPFKTADDAEEQIIVFGRDVTERVKLEQENEQWKIRTFHNQRLESIGRLAGGIAHDFNNYLHAIQGHLDIVQYMHPVDDPVVTGHLRKIDAITEKAALLTKQMLGFARKGKYTPTIFDPADLIQSTVDMIAPDFPERESAFRFKGIECPSAFRIESDMLQIQQTLLNILINARDAMKEIPEEKRRIFIELFAITDPESGFVPDPPPEAAAVAEKPCCVIRIADSGPGIPEKVRNRIFEPFFTTKPTGEGTGMGLSMAYGTMIAHGGWLQCKNDPDSYGGAVFELVFPLVISSYQVVSGRKNIE